MIEGKRGLSPVAFLLHCIIVALKNTFQFENIGAVVVHQRA